MGLWIGSAFYGIPGGFDGSSMKVRTMPRDSIEVAYGCIWNGS